MSKQQPTTTRTRTRSKRALRIFLNYRREDSSGHAGRLYDDLAERFGDDRIFMDIDKIEPGLDFDESIERALDSCDVVLAMIGRQWTTIADGKGVRRLDNPDDYVRLELEAALEKGMRLIPVRVQGTDMPSTMELPESLRALARRQAVELSDNRWRYDVDVLASALERLAVENAEKAREERGRIAEEQAQLEQAKLDKAEQTRLASEEEETRRQAAEAEERQRLAAEEEHRSAEAEEAERQRLAAEEESQRAELEDAERQRIATELEASRVAQKEAEERQRLSAEAEAERLTQERTAREKRQREQSAAKEAAMKQAADEENERRRRIAAEAERERKAQESAERQRREQERTVARQAESKRAAEVEKEQGRPVAPGATGQPLETTLTESRKPPYRRPAGLAAGAVLIVAIGAIVAIPLLGGGGEGAAAPVPEVAWPPGKSRPSIAGTARAGTTLTASRGTWRNSPKTFDFQWLSCTSRGTCTNIGGATSAKYELTGKDVGNRVRVVVTATSADGVGTSRSNVTRPVAAALMPPVSSVAPTVSGAARQGESLAARAGKWEGTDPIKRALVWQRCNAAGRSCVAIEGARGSRYTLRAQDVGRTVRVEERASNVAGRESVASKITAVIGAQPPPVVPPSPELPPPPTTPTTPTTIEPVPPPIDP